MEKYWKYFLKDSKGALNYYYWGLLEALGFIIIQEINTGYKNLKEKIQVLSIADDGFCFMKKNVHKIEIIRI